MLSALSDRGVSESDSSPGVLPFDPPTNARSAWFRTCERATSIERAEPPGFNGQSR